MGQKVNPIGLRVGINRTWDSRWYANRDYATLLHQDLRLRKHLQAKLAAAGLVDEHAAGALARADALLGPLEQPWMLTWF